MGGTNQSVNYTNVAAYLDLSQAFTRSKPSFVPLPDIPLEVSDASGFIDSSGSINIIGGNSPVCSSTINRYILGINSSSWEIAKSYGQAPGPRSGARAIEVGDKLLYFGGKSLTTCSDEQYYYNSLYSLEAAKGNWSIIRSTSSPVAEASMAVAPMNSDAFVLIGGESVTGSNAKASWLGMSQLAIYNATTSAWSFLPASSTMGTISPRSGHSAVSNGTNTFVYGGSLGSASASPSFFQMSNSGAKIIMEPISIANESFAPPASLYGHSAILTKQGIMIIAFGLVGGANSSTYNSQVYLFDTYSRQWLDYFDPSFNSQYLQVLPVNGRLSRSAVISMAIFIPFLITAILSTMYFVRRVKSRKRHAIPVPVNRLGTFTPDNNSYDFEKGEAHLHLPPWAAIHACDARSNFQATMPHIPFSSSSIGFILDNCDERQAEENVQNRMVQIACPSSPGTMTFTAPRLQLRVVNPDVVHTEATLASEDLETTGINQQESGRTTSTANLSEGMPVIIANEDDLETLRSKLARSPMISNSGYNGIEEQLSGLGFVINDTQILDTITGSIKRAKTITRKLPQIPQRSCKGPVSHQIIDQNTCTSDQQVESRLRRQDIMIRDLPPSPLIGSPSSSNFDESSRLLGTMFLPSTHIPVGGAQP